MRVAKGEEADKQKRVLSEYFPSLLFQNQAFAAPQIRQYQAAAPQQSQQYQQPQYKPQPQAVKQAPRPRPSYQAAESNAQRLLREEEEEENDVSITQSAAFTCTFIRSVVQRDVNYLALSLSSLWLWSGVQ